MTRTSTFILARALGGGAMLANLDGRFIVSDWSEGTGAVHGWPVQAGTWAGMAGQPVKGEYQRLPDNLAEPLGDTGTRYCTAPYPVEGLPLSAIRAIGAARHALFYGTLATDADERFVMEHIGQAALLASTDPHLNDIPLGQWDWMARVVRQRHALALKGLGGFWSLSSGVCILKAAARAIIARHTAKGEA